MQKGITMVHGRPRSWKSLAVLALAVSASLNQPIFGNARFKAEGPLRCVYMTEEDSRNLVAARLRWLIAGHYAQAPDSLWLSARRGLSLEAAESQAQIHDVVTSLSPDMLIFDTGRAFAPSVDKGPADAAPTIRFLRALLAETCLRSLLIVHHDTKPARDGKDERARSERSSGGILLSAADCPIGFERLSDRAALVVPDRYKVSADPAPFRLDFESATPAGDSFKEWLRVKASDESSSDPADVRDLALQERVLIYLRDNPGSAGNAVAKGLRAGKQAVLGALGALAEAGKVDSVGEKRKTSWFVHGSQP